MLTIKMLMRITLFMFGALLMMAPSAFSTGIVYEDFTDLSEITLNGSAKGAVDDSGRDVLRLTDGAPQRGSAFQTNAVSLGDDFSFSAHFGFRISNSLSNPDIDGPGADGIVFVMQTLSPYELGLEGGNIGYYPISTSIGIEFDTWQNKDLQDIDGNHVGINTSGNMISAASASVLPRMNDGDDWYSWIDYNGLTGQLEVRLSLANFRPEAPLLSYIMDLSAILENPDVYVGFTSATAGGSGYHDITSFEFNAVPEPATWVLLSLGMLFMMISARKVKGKKSSGL